VNLSTGKISVEEFGEEFVKKWLGTGGFAIHSFGNIKEKSLGEVWSSEDYAWFRFIVKNAIYPSCGDCLWVRRITLCPIPMESMGKFW